ncbi:MAG: hypothetical protein OEM63_03730 [Gammaproteobacteria bacterium]|nr:hypothetical protein [Gammaproteobacteria bacterium]
MDVVTSLIAIAVLLGLLLFVRRNARKENVRPDERKKAPAVKSTRFHAVSIRFAPNACEAAKKMEGRRFLSSAAPRIPLPECDALECKCRFRHHKDRRARDDRRNAWGQGFGGSTGKYPREQRRGGERRKN